MESHRSKPLRKYVVGIDAGKTTGLAVYNRHTSQLEMVYSTDFCGSVKFCETSFENKSIVTIIVELPGQFMYGRNDQMQGGTRDKALFGIAGNRREAQLLATVLRDRGFDQVYEVAPIREEKWTQEKFRLFTGKKYQANPHQRDAARLAIVYANHRG